MTTPVRERPPAHPLDADPAGELDRSAAPSVRPTGGRVAARLDGERSRERILDAAERLLAEHGYSGTGIAAISRESGLPASSIYWFFSSKLDLTLAVIERAAARWLDAFEPLVQRPDASDFRGFLERALAQSGSRLPDFARLLVLLSLERSESDQQIVERLRHVRERARGYVANSIATSLRGQGVERADEIGRELSFLAMSIAEGTLIGQHIEPGGIDANELAADLEVALMAIARRRIEGGIERRREHAEASDARGDTTPDDVTSEAANEAGNQTANETTDQSEEQAS